MRDKKLTTLVVLLAILSVGHTFDHVARGDLRWPLTGESVAFIIVTLTIYAVLGVSFFLHFTEKVGPLFWCFFGGGGIAITWAGHFSPFTDQSPLVICRAYQSAAAGWFAVSWLVALTVTLFVIVVYAEYLWARGLPAS